MADLSGPASAARPVQALPPRQLAVPWIAVAVLAAGAWGVTVMLARDMGNGPGTMGLALLPFLGLWVVMMAAMMLPSTAPVAVLWTRLISGASAGFGRVARLGLFLSGYLLTWAAVGAVAFAAWPEPGGCSPHRRGGEVAGRGDLHRRGQLPAHPLEGLVPAALPVADRCADVLTSASRATAAISG